MMGRVIQATSRFTGTSTVGVEAIGQTVISLDNVNDFATDMGAISIDGTILFYNALDRVAGTMTLTAPLAVALPSGTEIKSYPYSVQRWAFVLPDTSDSADAVWALVPHALSAFLRADGLRDEDDMEQVKIERDGTTMIVVDVLNDQPFLNPDSIPEGAITETKIEPGSITTPLIAANAVATQHLQAGSVKGVTIDGDALNGKVITGALVRSAATGKRVEMSATGIVQIDTDGTVLLSIGDQNKFTGSVDATSMIIRDSLQLFGKNNLFAIGSKVTLKASVGAPSQAPTLSYDYEQVTSVNISPAGWFTTGLHLDAGATGPHTSEIYWTSARYTSPTGKWNFPTIVAGGESVSEFKPWSISRLAKSDNNALRTVMIGEDANHIGGSGYSETWMRGYDVSGLASDGSVAPVKKWEAKVFDFSWFRQYKMFRLILGGGWKHHFGVVELNAPFGGGPQELKYTLYYWNNDDASFTPNGTLNLGSVIPEGEVLAGAVFGDSGVLGLDGSARTVFIVQTDKYNYVYNVSGGVWEANSHWPTVFNSQYRTTVGGSLTGNTADGWYSWNNAAGTDQKLYKYADNHKQADATLWATYVWRGEASQSFRTSMAPQASIAYRKRARLKVSMPALPAPIAGVGGARDSTKDVYGWVYFLGQGASAPARTAMYEQSNQPAMVANTALAVSSVVLGTYPVFSGTNPPSSSSFPTAAPATIESDNGSLKITGDGDVWAREFFGTAVDKLLDLILPPGVVILSGDDVAPYRTLLCDGAAVSRTTYSALFAKIGTTFGVGNGSTTFNLPNYKGRSPIGVGVADTGSIGNNYGLGQKYGHEDMQSHVHGEGTDTTSFVVAAGAAYGIVIPGNTASAGTGNSGNVHPVLGTNYYIRY